MWDNKRLDAGESMTDGSGDESGAGGGETRYYAEQQLLLLLRLYYDTGSHVCWP